MNAVPATGTGPMWSRNARMILLVGQVGGIALGLLGLAGAAGKHSIEDQIVWIDCTVGALLLAACTQAIWLLEGRRSVSLLRRRVAAHLVAGRTAAPADHRAAPAEAAAVVVAGGRSYHRPSCALVQGKQPVPFVDDGRHAPCGVCLG